MTIQPAVKKETTNIAVYTAVGGVLMFIVFFIVNKIDSELVPFDLTVILGGLCGMGVAVLNFFLMAITVQSVASAENEDKAKSIMKASYTRRMGLQLLWIVIALVAPVFNWIAGLLPLLFPGAGIKIKGIIGQRKN